MYKRIIENNVTTKTLLLVLILTISFLAGVILVFQYQPKTEIKIGHGLDHVFLNKIYPRQTRIDGKSYRRIKVVSHMFFPYLGDGLRYNIEITARTGEDYDHQPELITYVNKKKMNLTAINERETVCRFEFEEGKIKENYLLFHLINESEKTRNKKAIFLERVKIEPIKKGGLVLPSLGLLIRLASILLLNATAILIIKRRWGIIVAVSLTCAILIALLFFRVYFLPFINTLFFISLFGLIFSVIAKIILPVILRMANINPSIRAYQWFLLIFVLGLLIKSIVWFYPGTLTSDIYFHAHRFERVYESGDILQKSMTPEGTFHFPYPTLLYGILAPFKLITGASYPVLLKSGVILFDSLIPLLIFLFGLRLMRNETAGLFGAAIYSLIPLVTHKLLWGVCTESFAIFTVWLFILVLALSFRNLTSFKKAIPLTILLVIALLSHFGTAIEAGFFMVTFIVGAYLIYDSKRSKKRLQILTVVLLASLMIVFFAFYIHYVNLMIDQAQKVIKTSIGKEKIEQETKTKIFTRNFNRTFKYYGQPLFVVLIFSFPYYMEKRKKTTGFLTLSVIFTIMLLFFLISLFSPLNVRWKLFGTPAAALVSGWGLAKLSRYKTGKIITILFFIVMILIALVTWYSAMFNGPYHSNL